MKKRMILLLILVLLLEPWMLSLIRCEILTAKYADAEMLKAIDAHGMTDAAAALKVLEYKPYSYCKVYAKSDESGNVFILRYAFEDEKPDWEVIVWDTVWSKTGSADGFIWPYIR